MEFRRIIKFGNASHVVSLPKAWMEKNRLKKGDVVYYEETGNQDLVISPHEQKPAQEIEVTLHLEQSDPDEIQRLIISKYLAGCDVFNIHWKGDLQPQQAIRKVIQDLMALEIIEQTGNRIIAKDFLNVREVSLQTMIRRMDTILRSMFEDLQFIYKTNYENLYLRDQDVNKLSKLCLRVIKKALHDPSLAQHLKMNPADLVNIRDLITFLETVGDNIKRISKHMYNAKISERKLHEFKVIFTRVQVLFEEVMKSFYKNDQSLAYLVASQKDTLVKDANAYMEEMSDVNAAHAMEKLKEIAVYTRNMARVVYNTEKPKEVTYDNSVKHTDDSW